MPFVIRSFNSLTKAEKKSFTGFGLPTPYQTVTINGLTAESEEKLFHLLNIEFFTYEKSLTVNIGQNRPKFMFSTIEEWDAIDIKI